MEFLNPLYRSKTTTFSVGLFVMYIAYCIPLYLLVHHHGVQIPGFFKDNPEFLYWGGIVFPLTACVLGLINMLLLLRIKKEAYLYSSLILQMTRKDMVWAVLTTMSLTGVFIEFHAVRSNFLEESYFSLVFGAWLVFIYPLYMYLVYRYTYHRRSWEIEARTKPTQFDGPFH